jgi:hypothetical protein
MPVTRWQERNRHYDDDHDGCPPAGFKFISFTQAVPENPGTRLSAF